MKVLSILTLTFFICVSAYAQKPTAFSAKTADVSKISAKFDFPAEGRSSKNGGGYSTNVDLLDPKPKKVALISYYLYDPACGEEKHGGASSSASIWTVSQATAQVHVDGFYNNSIEDLKAGFKEYGIDLLTPDQFLDSEEKKEYYYGFNQESGKKEKTTRTQIGHYVSVKGNTLKICPTDKGYRPFFVVNEPLNASLVSNFVNTGVGGANRKMTSSLGYELAKGLGVDAVVVAVIVTRKPKKNKNNFAVDAVSLYMMGPNPKSDGPEDKNRGQFYVGSRYFAKQSTFSDAKTGVTSYDNMNNVMKAISKKAGNWVINRAKK